MSDAELIFAKTFLYASDPYGDGIRLDHIRNPSQGYLVAEELVHDRQHWFGGLEIMIEERGKEIADMLRNPHEVSAMVRNTDITRDDVKTLKEFMGIEKR